MKTIITEITAFTAVELRELHPDGFETARADYQNSLEDAGYFDDTLTECVFPVALANMGLTSLTYAPLRYSLSSCQGDGVSFDDFDPTEQSIKELGLELPAGLDASDFIVRRDRDYIGNHYTHENTFDAEYNGDYIDWTDEKEKAETVERFAKDLTDALRSVCLKLERAGYDFIWTGISADNFIENAEANEWLFDEEGNIVA